MLNFPSIFSIYVHTSLVRSLLLWFYEQRSCIHFHFPFHTDNAKYVILRQIEKKSENLLHSVNAPDKLIELHILLIAQVPIL